MRETRRKIAILFHENEKKTRPGYLIMHLADIWREQGMEVFFLFGLKKFVPADLIIVHVNLSVVPDDYFEFAKQYPIVLNGEIKDIQKSTFSKHLVGKDDPFDGKVIVKSNLNFAGLPELELHHPYLFPILLRSPFKLLRHKPSFNSPLDYKFFDHIRLVPPFYFENPRLVVEKFLPEIEKGLYCVRSYHFLGDRMTCNRLMSRHPIVKGSTHVKNEEIEPNPEIIELHKEMNFDYGKFDYVMHDGKLVLLDINKTTGFGSLPYTPELRAAHYHRAAGIYSYFKKI